MSWLEMMGFDLWSYVMGIISGMGIIVLWSGCKTLLEDLIEDKIKDSLNHGKGSRK